MSPVNKVWVETDMRAHFNPTRMQTLNRLANKLALRLLSLCPKCKTPGWGKIKVQIGLECICCGKETAEIKFNIYGCTKCDHKECILPQDGSRYADPGRCPNCNP